MSNTNTPRGFKPLRYVDNRPFSGGFNTYRIASGYATNIFAGDVVKLLTTGYINKASAGDQMRGVALGFRWTASNGVPQWSAYWPASTVTFNSLDAVIEVIDDPKVIFEAVFTNSTSVPATADIGANFNLIDNGGSTATGLSGEGIDYTTLTTSAAQFNLIEYVTRIDNDTTSAYSRGQFLPKLHDFNVTTGI